MKFVESQVQSVGSSVKRLYSNVVHDILPLSTETVKPERQLAQICQHLLEQGNATVQNSEDSSSAEKNITEDLKGATADSSFDSELFPGKLDKEDISSTPAFSAHEEYSTSIEFSAHEECSTSIEKERRDLSPQEGDESFSNDTVYHSDSLLSRSESKSAKDENVDLSTSTQSSEYEFSYNFCNEKEEQMAIMPSTFCISPESSVAMECTSADFSMGADNDLHSRSVSDGCTDNISAESSISAADKTKEVDVDPASLIMESNGWFILICIIILYSLNYAYRYLSSVLPFTNFPSPLLTYLYFDR